jgi:SEC-C motif-containing protein
MPAPHESRAVSSAACPCGGARYAECCEPFISGARLPATCEQLMRSRYTAYTLGKESYLLQTWHPSTRPAQLALHTQPPRWLGLNVVATQDGGADATHGVVEFVARYKIGGKAHRLHEVSRFVKEGGRWFYVDGAMSQI